ncbi:nitronate monooxygenase [Solirubrobacter ginsenosidimutans]|uniref:Propionate 3-nitronate monooxygenase n=1 Tax=Solirubrobacter ginsenosidimutans TaxID=490573 RepID=A0A9X3MUR2_9ACTN|nr:nitronate monooxygenase [Solirubrobacter ginsenosidimutans]MDA0162296.1 nitronate monooxygenase [Solirubrobacter ginsenosidimutans]
MTLPRTRVSELLQLDHPVIQGPFGGGLSSLELAAAVSNAGGLGSFGAQHLSPEQLTETIRALRERTDRAFNVNLWVSTHDVPEETFDWDAAVARLRPLYDAAGVAPPERPRPSAYAFDVLAEALIMSRPPVFSFVYGVPDARILDACREAGIVTIGTAVTVDEAVALDEAGVDAIVASGFEAGGHRIAFLRPPGESLIGTLALVPATVDAVQAPVIAAGGIADARQVAAAFALGAEAVQVGTAFLATRQSAASPAHREALSHGPRDTRLTKAFTGRLARALASDFRLADSAPFPYQAMLTRPLVSAHWAGQSAPLVQPDQDAVELLLRLVAV